MLAIDLTPDGWFNGLPKIQRESIEQLLEAGQSEDEVGELWLSRTGSNNTVGFGVGGPIQSFYSNVKKEFVAFVCDDEKYSKERSEASKIWATQGKISLVSMVASVIAINVGLAAAAIVPIVALLFSLATKIGINAFCAACVTGPPKP